MKKILFLVLFVMFSVAVSAHQQTIAFNSQTATKSLIAQNSAAYTSMYSVGNGGIIQLIYNIVNKVGHVVYTTLHDEETPKEQETTTEN